MPAIIYPAPHGISASPRYAVEVDARPSFTYLTTGPDEAEFTAGHIVSWTSFDMDGPVEVRVERKGRPISSAVVRPLSSGLEARIEEGVVFLTLDRPIKLSVECDGDLTDVLFLFANAPEVDIPSREDPNVVCFEPGVHEIGKFYTLRSNTTYYLAAGAYLKGSFAGGGDGTRVIGRGILSGEDYKWPGHLKERGSERVDLVKLAGDGIELSGITLVDSPYYVIIAPGRGHRFHNLKLMAWYNNTDGVSAGPGARIDDCFLRLADDAFKPYVNNTQITNCVLWMDRAAAFQLSWNAREDSGNSVVRNCDVIHHIPFLTHVHEWTGSIFWAWHGGTAHIHDILFEDIRIEGDSPRLLNVFLQRNPWSPQEGQWGRFSRIRFRRVSAERPFLLPSRLLGRDEAHPMDQFHFEGLSIMGQSITSAEALPLETNAFVSGLSFDGSI